MTINLRRDKKGKVIDADYKNNKKISQICCL